MVDVRLITNAVSDPPVKSVVAPTPTWTPLTLDNHGRRICDVTRATFSPLKNVYREGRWTTKRAGEDRALSNHRVCRSVSKHLPSSGSSVASLRRTDRNATWRGDPCLRSITYLDEGGFTTGFFVARKLRLVDGETTPGSLPTDTSQNRKHCNS